MLWLETGLIAVLLTVVCGVGSFATRFVLVARIGTYDALGIFVNVGHSNNSAL